MGINKKPQNIVALFSTDGTIEPLNPKNGKNFPADEVREVLGGDFEEIVCEAGYTAYIRINGEAAGAPFNHSASYHLDQFKAPTGHPEPYGPMILTTEPEMFCEDDEWEQIEFLRSLENEDL